MRVLVVEDSDKLRNIVAKTLKRSGYAVDTAADGDDGFALASEIRYDTVILDIMLPGLDGLTLLQRLREEGREAPVLLLTARDTVEDRVHGLECGADDYLTKPFALEELIARVAALCRRRYGRSDPIVRVGDLELDASAKTVTRAGQPIELTAREFALLEYLVSRRGAVVSRTDIETHIYDDMVSPMSNVVDSAVCALRRKLAVEGADGALIRTRRGLGYVLQSEDA